MISSSNQQQTQSFDKLHDKLFWIWNIQEHKQEDVRTKGECCFNHIIGLPTKEGLEKPIFDYIDKTKASPAFDREYSLKYMGLIGNVFHTIDIEAAIQPVR